MGAIATSFAFANLNPLYQALIAIGFFFVYLIALFLFFFVQLFFETFFESKKKKRKYPSKYFRKLLGFYNKFLFSLFGMKIKYSGIEKLDKKETYMIVSNHKSNLDSLVIDNYLQEFPLIFIAKDSLFKIPMVGRVIHGCGYLKLNRGDLKQELGVIKEAIQTISREDNPQSIGVFPEGTRGKSSSYKTGEFKAGCFHIALKTHKPIVVSAIKGTDKVNNNLLFKTHKINYDIIKVVEYSEYKDMNSIELSLYIQSLIDNYFKE